MTYITVTYDTTEDSNQNRGIGLGCNGVIDVLIEPTESNLVLNKLVALQEPFTLATIYNGPDRIGQKLLLKKGFTEIGEINDSELHSEIVCDLKDIFHSGRSGFRTYRVHENKISAFVELIQPTISLLIFGGGLTQGP